MVNRTLEQLLRARAWIPSPSCLLDRLLDQIETLSSAVVVPDPAGRLSCSEAPIEASLDHLGMWRR